MANITINVPDGVVARVLDAIAVRHNWKPGDGTKAQFAKATLIKWIKKEVTAHEAGIATNAAGAMAEASVESEITLT